MAKKTHRTAYQDKKISETFLDFAGPLLEIAAEQRSMDLVKAALKLSFTVWNSVALDTVNGNDEYITALRKCLAEDPVSATHIEKMIFRKKALFGDDLRLVSDYQIVERDGEWRLRAEARAPGIKGNIC